MRTSRRAFLGGLGAATVVRPARAQTRVTIGFTGDSNLGGKQPTFERQTYVNASRIFTLDSSLRFIQASDPIFPNYAVGPALSCADRYITQVGDPSLEVCVVPKLAGAGLKMADLQLGQQGYNDIYSHLLYAAQNWGPVIGVVVIVGLHDATAYQDMVNWAPFARYFRKNLRIHLANSSLRFVFNNFASKPAVNQVEFDDFVRQSISEAAFDDTNSCVLTCAGFSVNSPTDGYHFDAAGQVSIGHAQGDLLA